MHLRLDDLDHTHDSKKCYLTHACRSEDTDDTLIDVANQLGFDRKDLSSWVESPGSWEFMESINGCEIDSYDFLNEFESGRCAYG